MTESWNNKYSAADLERYHAGKMSAGEMHALEKAAMEDPFLADALEGYAYAATPQKDLEQIRTNLFGEKKEEKTVPFIRRNYNWLKAAAIIIFVAGGAWLAFQVSDQKKTDTSVATQKKEDKKSVVTDTIQQPNFSEALTQSKNDTFNVAAVHAGADGRQKTVSNTLSTGSGFGTFLWSIKDSSNRTDERELARQSPFSAATDSVNLKIAGNIDTYRNNMTPFNTEVSNMNASNATSRMPLPGYNNTYKTTPRKDIDTATYFMKESKAKFTDSITNFNIVLQPDTTDLSEVVVSSGKKQEPDKRSFELKVDTLEPKDGWKSFDDYIASNIQVPDELKSKQPYTGEVELVFDINKNGEPINITVTRSLCEKCDQEAIRLLKEGPKWKKKKSKKGKVTIKF